MSYLFYQILKLKEFLIASGLTGLILMILFLLWAVRPKKGLAWYGAQAFFFRRGARDIVYLSGVFLQLIFVVSSLVGKVTVDRVHLFLLAALCLLKFLAHPGVRRTAVDIGYSALLVALLLVNNMLAGFIWQTRADMWARAMYYLLCMFIMEFAVYYFLKQLQNLLVEKSNRLQRESDVHE